jgi:hypothetical protein
VAQVEKRTLGRKPIEIDRPTLFRDRPAGLAWRRCLRVTRFSSTGVARAQKPSGGAMMKPSIPPASVDAEILRTSRNTQQLQGRLFFKQHIKQSRQLGLFLCSACVVGSVLGELYKFVSQEPFSRVLR